jgi:hypothetical protein
LLGAYHILHVSRIRVKVTTCKTITYYISLRSNVTSNVIGPIILTASLNILLTEATAHFKCLRTEDRSLKNFSVPASARVHLFAIYCATHRRELIDDTANKAVLAAKCKMEGIVFFKSHSKRSSTVHLKINIPKYETRELLDQIPSSGLSAAVLVKLKKRQNLSPNSRC